MQQILLMILMAAGTFILTVLISRITIPKLRSLKMGQKILDIGPRWHKNKEGTPTMGGITFIVAALLMIIGFSVYTVLTAGAAALSALYPFYAVFGFALLQGLIGMVDDTTKILKKQNEGLTPAQKYLLQLTSAGLFLLVMRILGAIDTSLYIPFFKVTWELGIFYYPVALILITGMVNSVNLTDGIDGLASGETLIVGIFIVVAAAATASSQIALIGAIAIGSALGFLVYNFYPARVFMGDTGSLYFGGLLIGCGFLMGNPLIIMVAGIMFIVETASVILQTTWFKITRKCCGEGKRIFKMSPIHHHFELCGWKEVKIVSVFCLINLIFSAISFILEYIVQ